MSRDLAVHVAAEVRSVGGAGPSPSPLLGTRQLDRGVTRIVVMSDLVLPLAEIKKRLSEIVDGVEQRHDRVVLTRNGRAAAVILSPEDLAAIEDTLEILSDPEARREIRRAEAELDAGRGLSADELRARYLERG
jgi:prevent-host-death family protein